MCVSLSEVMCAVRARVRVRVRIMIRVRCLGLEIGIES